jgi:hypothetical protein
MTSTNQTSSHETFGIFSSKHVVEMLRDMAQAHFRRMDESEPESPPDKEAEAEINALFDKNAMDDDALVAFIDHQLR